MENEEWTNGTHEEGLERDHEEERNRPVTLGALLVANRELFLFFCSFFLAMHATPRGAYRPSQP